MLAKPIMPVLESIMRYSSVAVAAAFTLMTVSTALHGQRPDDQIDPRSLALLAKGQSAKAAGNLDGATDALETPEKVTNELQRASRNKSCSKKRCTGRRI